MSLYPLSEHKRGVAVQEPRHITVRQVQDGAERTVALIEEWEDGELVVTVAPGVTIRTSIEPKVGDR